MSTELALVGMGEKLAYANELSRNGLLPAAYRDKPGNVLWAIEYGLAMGIAPVIAMGQIHLMDGKPVASATMIGGLVRRAGHRLRAVFTKDGCTVTIFRKDDQEFGFTVEWTLADAKRAGIDRNPNWSKYPMAMCAARAQTMCARLACPEVLMGVEYTAEELGGPVFAEDLPMGSKPAEAPRWSDAERKGFCASLTALGWEYEAVAAWCESLGKPRPSVMPVAQRNLLLAHVAGGKGATQLAAWIAAQAPAPVDTEFAEPELEPFDPAGT